MNLERDYSLDAACGLMIIYMIYGHICAWSGVQQIELFPRLLFYFMPWFFFKSGMFFREKTLKKEFVNGVKKLIVPYIVFSIIGQLVFYLMWIAKGETSCQLYIMAPLRTLLHEGAVVGNSPLWFLLSLFCVKIIFDDIYVKFHNLGGYLLVLFTGLSAYLLRYIEFNNYFYIANICCGVFFYGCGYVLRKYVDKKWVIFVSFCLYVVYSIIYPSYFDFRSNNVAIDAYPLCLLSCIGGIIIINAIFKKVKSIQIPFISIGKNSMTYYTAHWVVLGVSSLLFQNIMHLIGYELFVAFSLANIVMLPLLDIFFNKHCKWIIGK